MYPLSYIKLLAGDITGMVATSSAVAKVRLIPITSTLYSVAYTLVVSVVDAQSPVNFTSVLYTSLVGLLPTSLN